ncbi:replication initiation factor domain-containing protein [Lacticaseibacillus paracasei]|uniref:replication initiation factor domain-containing protein n=1 Tax=Lacticaseibacillus paracasei TaxID=1597 RepID=UPI0039080A38
MGYWSDSVRRRRKELNLTQLQLCNRLGITQRHLSRIENGESCSSGLQMHIDKLLNNWTDEPELQMMIDYVRIRFPTSDIKRIIREFLRLNEDLVGFDDRAAFGYVYTESLGQIKVYGSTPDTKLGTLVELRGQGCRQMESILLGRGETWYDFLETCIALDGHFTRVDLAINDRNGLLDVPTLIEKCDRDEFTSRFHGFRDNRTKQWEVSGRTLYLGSPQSEVYFCIYDKAFEQHQKHPEIAIEDQPIRTRFEVRLRRKRAAAAIKNLLAERDPEKVVFGIINRYLRFLTPSHKAKSQWATDPRWDAFIGNYRDKLRLSTNPEPLSYAHITRWLKKQVAPSLKMLQLIDQYNGTTELKAIIDGGKLTQRHWDLIHHYQHHRNGVLTDAAPSEQSKKDDHADQSK